MIWTCHSLLDLSTIFNTSVPSKLFHCKETHGVNSLHLLVVIPFSVLEVNLLHQVNVG